MELLEERDVAHAFFDGDWFTYFHPSCQTTISANVSR
jgi:hypothetical protein